MPLLEVAHQTEQLQSQKPDGHTHTKNAIMLRACTTSSAPGQSNPGETKSMEATTPELASGGSNSIVVEETFLVDGRI